ncbi:TetR/AcrR family transcriptional regulator [Pseudonocardia sp. TRM90224]|uniref:TetR/AcrR family transcriptional regulator n=1 Tax=Pseudonocardia sp. TRM90224 TaxID=2812678 RepID=UPI001E4177E2|nr:TetR/AcrR family transcriptional regulator [Pseudonocardia sp. TRM90224]
MRADEGQPDGPQYPGSGRGSWTWSRTAETRRVILDAARDVFAEVGFADASVARVVEKAGSSVGSLYHHFGGKAELFLALYEEWQGSQEHRAASAVAQARHEGETRPLALFITGARAFLAGSWEGRGLADLFLEKDGPPGFELMRRTRAHAWLRQNSLLLEVDDDPIGRVTVAVLTTIIGEASREIVTSTTRDDADRITDAAVAMIERLGVFDTA